MINTLTIIKMKTPVPFYVINYDVNKREFIHYNIMDYLVRCYEEIKKNDRPTTFDEFKDFVDKKSSYMYAYRCEYEIILQDLLSRGTSKKIDIYWQIKQNIDTITQTLMKNVGVK